MHFFIKTTNAASWVRERRASHAKSYGFSINLFACVISRNMLSARLSRMRYPFSTVLQISSRTKFQISVVEEGGIHTWRTARRSSVYTNVRTAAEKKIGTDRELPPTGKRLAPHRSNWQMALNVWFSVRNAHCDVSQLRSFLERGRALRTTVWIFITDGFAAWWDGVGFNMLAVDVTLANSINDFQSSETSCMQKQMWGATIVAGFALA